MSHRLLQMPLVSAISVDFTDRPNVVGTHSDRARLGSGSSVGALLQLYRNYLTVLATTQIERRLRSRLSPSDVVQETMLRAHKNFGQFRGATEPELIGWLRQILVNNLAKFVEQHVLGRAARRTPRGFHRAAWCGAGAIDNSAWRRCCRRRASRRAWPCSSAKKRLCSPIGSRNLPDDYREVLMLRNLQGLPFDEVAQQMERSVGAVRMLWLRAIERLRVIYQSEESHGA